MNFLITAEYFQTLDNPRPSSHTFIVKYNIQNMAYIIQGLNADPSEKLFLKIDIERVKNEFRRFKSITFLIWIRCYVKLKSAPKFFQRVETQKLNMLTSKFFQKCASKEHSNYELNMKLLNQIS
jgi:hypothetical protein